MRKIIAVLTLGLTVIGMTGCGSSDSGGKRSRYSYNFKVNGCPVSHIKGSYSRLEDMCSALMLETQQNPCGAIEIYREFEAHNCHRSDFFSQQNQFQNNGQMLNPGGFIDHSGRDVLDTPNGRIILEDTPDRIYLDDELAYEDDIINSRIENYYVDLKNKKAIIDGRLEIDLSVLDDDGSSIYVHEEPRRNRPRVREDKVITEEPVIKTPPVRRTEEKKPTPVVREEERREERVTKPEPRPSRVEKPEVVAETPAEVVEKPVAETPAETIAPSNFNLVSYKSNGVLYSEVPSPSSKSRLPILKITSTLDSRSPLHNKKHLDATTALQTEIIEPAANGCDVLSYISTSKEVLVLSLQVKDKNNETQIAACKTWFKSIGTTGFKIRTPKLNTDKGNQITGEFEFINRD